MMTSPSGQELPDLLRQGGEAFALGRFEEARPLYEAALSRAPERLDPPLRLAMLALLDDRIPEARRHAARAVGLAPDMALPRALLAEASYRGDDYPPAAECYDALQRSGLAAKARRLAETGAYRRSPPSGSVRLPLRTDGTLPVIAARIDGRAVHLLVDTAAGELLVDRSIAGGARVPHGAPERIAFAGGRTAMVDHGVVRSVELGGLSLEEVPCQALDLTNVFAPLLDLPIHGVLGLGVLRRFAVALDFRLRELRLSWPGATTPEAGRPQRLWLAAGHFLVTSGEAGVGRRITVVLDTGLSGIDCVAARSLAERLALSPGLEGETAGRGGGGEVEGRTVRLSRMGVGGLSRAEVRAAVLPRFALERQLGFQVAALVASDFFGGAVLSLDFDRMELSVT